MNFADIQNTWRSPHNRPAAAEIEEIKMKLIDDLKRRRRGNVLLLALVLALLLFFTGKIALHVLWPDPALDRVDLAREWGIIPFYALPWIGWFALLRMHLRQRSQHPRADESIHASVRALLDENRMEATRHKVIAALLVASAVLLPLIVWQLRAVGKAGGEVLVPALVLYPCYVAGVLVWARIHYRRKLLPRRRELEALLAAYTQ